MKTRITEMLGIQHPIFLSGMSWISVPEMVAAVSNAGGLGILATGPLSKEQTRESIHQIRRLTDKPFGANASLLFPGAVDSAKILLEEKVPVINFALGKGDWIVREAHQYGGKVMATVVNARHAKRAQDYGCDAVIATGNEAAAHGESVTTFCLIPSLVDALNIPVVAAGGIADGRGLAAAIALGADGVAMGTRIMTTKESPLHQNYKDLSRKMDTTDTIYSRRIDGLWCRVLKTDAAERMRRRGLNLPAAFFNSQEIAKMLHLPFIKLFFGVMLSGWKTARQLAFLANAFKAFRLATEAGDLKEGVLPVGQCTGLIHDEPTVKELFDRMVQEAEAIEKKMANIFG
ncbi:MAG TPA: nitronate monooxygenase [Desulfomonilia bacterium]|jgi:enoyl-[acyl-carrier protein] reductase II|nr:nitronate monooxygenase [Thermodesulfobacteriota bacterium]HWR69277.1 nitronate monooxygenase [Desulfomonilia bacterium]